MGIHSNERQDKIFSMLESRGRVSVSDLAEYFQVTETTIRRDLITMEENHQIVRRRGFAELPLQATSGLRRRNTFQEEKQRIARKAMELISYGTTLALDSGTSVAELVHVLADEGRDMGIDVITPSIQTASETCRFFRTSMPGGYVFPDEVSIGGMSAVRFLEGVTTDIAFLGTTGICNTKGLTVSYPLMMDVKRALLSSASKKVALVDSSKFLSRGIYTYCSFRELDTLITVRTEENAPVLDEIAKQGVEIILA